MKNLKKLIEKSDFKTQENFGRALFPNLTNKQVIKNKANMLIKRDFSIIHRCQVLLNCTFNELMEDERATD